MKKAMKKAICLLLSLAALPGLCACAGGQGNGADPAGTTEPATKQKQLEEPAFDYIAYSRLDDGDKGPINSEEHLRYCASLPYTTLKADVQLTSDGGLVLCHDKGFTFSDGRIVTYDKNNSMPIYNLTTQQCLSLEYNKQYDGKHCKVTDFETFIRICSESDKWAFITVRDEHIDEVVAAVMPILEKYNWVENSIINSFTVYTLEAFRRASPDIKLSYVLQYGKTLTRMDVDTALRLGNCIVNTFHFRVSDTQTGWTTMEQSADGIAYAKAKGVKLYQAQVAQGVDIKKLIEAGYSGAQLRFVPEFTQHTNGAEEKNENSNSF